MTWWHVLAAALVATAPSCKRNDAPPPPSPRPAETPPAPPARENDRIPRASGTIKIDGEWDEPDWPQHALRFQFRGQDGELARPSSEVRFVYDPSALYVGLYAADQNIVAATDAFDLKIGSLPLRIDPKGHVTPAMLDVRVGVDSDGTIDDPKDDDEEWKLEVAIPLQSTGLGGGRHVPVSSVRCDVPKDGIERCGSWSGSLALDE